MAGGPEPVLWSILLIILGAKLGGELAERFRQPAVLGELLVGVLFGAALLGSHIGLPDFALEQDHTAAEDALHEAEDRLHVLEEAGAPQDQLAAARADVAQHEAELGALRSEHGREITTIQILGALATIGVILLLFEVGLESDVRELTRVGSSSLIVALIGVVVSFAAGYAFSWALTNWWAPWEAAGTLLGDHLLHTFVGATLTATSVGITARVLGDMGQLRSRESRIILGAAIIDDIAGLIILAIVAAMVTAAATGGAVETMEIVKIAATAVGFLVLSLLVGLRTVPRLYDALIDRFKVKGFPVALAISFALLMSYLATLAGLANIVGAFAAGLLLAQTKHAHHIFEDLRPIAAIFVSFFFVTLGMRVDFRAMQLADGTSVVVPVLLIGVALTVVAVAAKVACGWGVLSSAKASRLVVGVGMSPRGEVGLIFAGLGLATGLITNWQYTTVIIVVMLTTFLTPIWLKRLGGAFGGEEVKGREPGVGRIMEA